MKKQNYLCVDVTTVTKEKMVCKKAVTGKFVMDEEQEHFTFREKGDVTPHPELQWHLMDRTKHGKMSINSRHVKVEFYIHHDEYQSESELADILASEIEQMGDRLCDMDIQQALVVCC